ncbi:hypothetical protein ACFYO2_24645 [Streptomyces sp. NPDC006602]|uniref:hypothetical protein n=1 Tax=Streptomyces sp. NPDC006602 TaxID=3364751 RepID=UPI0036CF08B5
MIAADAVSFLLAAAFFARMSLPDLPPRTDDGPPTLGELREGRSYFTSSHGSGR